MLSGDMDNPYLVLPYLRNNTRGGCRIRGRGRDVGGKIFCMFPRCVKNIEKPSKR
jgi:hypothetical protein